LISPSLRALTSLSHSINNRIITEAKSTARALGVVVRLHIAQRAAALVAVRGRSTMATSGFFASLQMSMHTERASLLGPIVAETTPSSFAPLRWVVEGRCWRSRAAGLPAGFGRGTGESAVPEYGDFGTAR
jgi:hypothetical protein